MPFPLLPWQGLCEEELGHTGDVGKFKGKIPNPLRVKVTQRHFQLLCSNMAQLLSDQGSQATNTMLFYLGTQASKSKIPAPTHIHSSCTSGLSTCC